MCGNHDLGDDILPLVINGILDPGFITGEDPEKEDDKDREKDEKTR
jgi:hypothetical protein